MPHITGPCALKIGANDYLYFEDGLNVAYKTKTGTIVSDFHGEQAKFFIGATTVLTGRPEGMISAAYFAALFPSVAIGASVLTATDVPIVVWTKAGQKITWARGGVTKFPELMLSATKPLFSGTMEVTCLGALTTSGATALDAAAHWNAITSVSFADASYDSDPLVKCQYTAAFGSSPYAAMTAKEGFKVSIELETEEIMDDNVGVAEIVAKSVTASCSFMPSNLTEAQVWTLLAIQNTGARMPGQRITGAQDLVITGLDGTYGLELTLSKPGFADASMVYKVGELRQGEIMAYAARTYTSGAADALYTFDVTEPA